MGLLKFLVTSLPALSTAIFTIPSASAQVFPAKNNWELNFSLNIPTPLGTIQRSAVCPSGLHYVVNSSAQLYRRVATENTARWEFIKNLPPEFGVQQSMSCAGNELYLQQNHSLFLLRTDRNSTPISYAPLPSGTIAVAAIITESSEFPYFYFMKQNGELLRDTSGTARSPTLILRLPSTLRPQSFSLTRSLFLVLSGDAIWGLRQGALTSTWTRITQAPEHAYRITSATLNASQQQIVIVSQGDYALTGGYLTSRTPFPIPR